MNIDDGNIRPWDLLSAEEKESGRWVKLSEDEFAMAENVAARARRENLKEIFGDPKTFAEMQAESRKKFGS